MRATKAKRLKRLVGGMPKKYFCLKKNPTTIFREPNRRVYKNLKRFRGKMDKFIEMMARRHGLGVKPFID